MADFDQSFRQHFPGVLRFAEGQAGRRDIAEDLVTDAFAQLHGKSGGVALDRDAAWLFDVVRSRAREFWRRHLAEARHAQWLAGPAHSPQAAAAAPPWLSRKDMTLAQRACVELHYVWDFSVSDIAVRLGLSGDDVIGHIQGGAAQPAESPGMRPVPDTVRPGPDADDVLREQGASWRRARTGCPHPDLLFARRSDAVDPAVHEALAGHLAVCAECAALARAIDAVGHDVSDGGVEGRVRKRATAHASRRPLIIAVAFVMTAALVVGGWWQSRRAGEEAAAPVQPVAEVNAPLWRVEPAPVRALTSDSRRVASGGDDAKTLEAALEPYRIGRFEEASVRLDPYVRAHPVGPRGLLYSGVALLIDGHPEAALPLLERATSATLPDGADEIAWYRATAEQRTGLREVARGRLAALCSRAGPYQSRACAAQATLR